MGASRSPASYMSNSGSDRERIGFVGNRGIDRLEHEHALTGVRGDTDPAVTASVFDLRERGERSAAAVAEQHHCVGATRPYPRDRSGDVACGRVVEAVRVVVEVAGRESEHGEPGCGQERARVVHREVAAGMGQNHGSPPRAPVRRRPEQAAHQRAVLGDDPHRLASHLDTRIVFGERPVTEPERSLLAEEDVGHGRLACLADTTARRGHARSREDGGSCGPAAILRTVGEIGRRRGRRIGA